MSDTPQPIPTVQDRMRELATLQKEHSSPEAAIRTATLKRLLLVGIDREDLNSHQRQLRGNVRNLCCGMNDEEVIEYYTQEREAGRNFKADCILEFFAS